MASHPLLLVSPMCRRECPVRGCWQSCPREQPTSEVSKTQAKTEARPAVLRTAALLFIMPQPVGTRPLGTTVRPRPLSAQPCPASTETGKKNPVPKSTSPFQTPHSPCGSAVAADWALTFPARPRACCHHIATAPTVPSGHPATICSLRAADGDPFPSPRAC